MILTDIEAHSMDYATLSDWYIASVGEETPIWTDEHIDELLNDFYVIPKDAPTVEVGLVKRGEWIPQFVSNRGLTNFLYALSAMEVHTHQTNTANVPIDIVNIAVQK